MKTVIAVVMLVLALCATPARAQLVDDSLGARQKLADAGYRYDDTASLLRALQDENDTAVGFAIRFLSVQRATPEIIAALRATSDSPRESVAVDHSAPCRGWARRDGRAARVGCKGQGTT